MQPNNPFQNARWIGTGRFASPVIHRTFPTGAVENATLFVTGLGYFEARLNDQPVTRERFLPPVSDYEPRRPSKFLYPLTDRPTNRIYYCEFDVTDLLREGENCLTIQLGNGFYRQTERVAEGPTGYGEILKTIYSLKLLTSDGSISLDSDGSEVCGPSEITYSQLFIGEIINPTAPREATSPVELLPDPEAVLSPRLGPGDICSEVLHPISLGGGIYDAGKNISGLVRLRTHAPQGSRILLRFAENLTPGGDLDFTSTGADYICASGRPQIMEDVFICDGEDRWFEPKFVWHAFRYFSVQGEFDEAQVLVIHSDCPVTATFESPSEGLNHLFEAFLRTQLNNMHGGIPSDCPHRERLGYTGDGQVCAEAAMLTMDCREFYRKWIRDILDCQDSGSGHVQHTAPPDGWRRRSRRLGLRHRAGPLGLLATLRRKSHARRLLGPHVQVGRIPEKPLRKPPSGPGGTGGLVPGGLVYPLRAGAFAARIRQLLLFCENSGHSGANFRNSGPEISLSRSEGKNRGSRL